ncbi:MAG: hypothetical protein DCC68_14885 [Planctomycetota bacterium]|nr:MAG: hypothetical protein DCC68_14885 [Planctomycetota bacterium]
MRNVGELCLFATLVLSGVAAFVGLSPGLAIVRRLRAGVTFAVNVCLVLLTVVVGILAVALCRCDFAFDYVARNSSELLPWYYSLSSLWVGQAGSLLLWAWFLTVLAAAFRWRRRRAEIATDIGPANDSVAQAGGGNVDRLAEPTCGVLMGYLAFLVAIMVFAADPMAANPRISSDGAGLSPLLQHPAMLIHPPVVFLGYALWTMPFALAIAALATGRTEGDWLPQARRWSLAAWMVLGAGILLGAQWAYEELGWGGYWGWDPVENGSLIPWIAGTAAVHALMVWQHCKTLKKTAVALVIATFGLCNFATFLTRSGVFSSLHAFSNSPIGWLFLALMAALLASGGYLLVRRRALLAADRPWGAVLSRESVILVAIVALMLFLTAVLGGTLSSAISSAVAERVILVGPSFYNGALLPVALVLLPATALAPLLRWGKSPTGTQARCIAASAAAGSTVGAGLFAMGALAALPAAVAGIGAFSVASLVAALGIDVAKRTSESHVAGFVGTVALRRPLYAGFVVHLGFVALSLGVAASSAGSRQQDVRLPPGDAIDWNGRRVRFVEPRERMLPDKMIVEAELVVASPSREVVLAPARHFHRLAGDWTTEVAIDSTLWSDVYAILHGTDAEGRVRLTLIENPMVAWIWLGGIVMGIGGLLRLWPARRRDAARNPVSTNATVRAAPLKPLRDAA